MTRTMKYGILWFFIAMLAVTASATPQIVIEFFYQPGCHDCENVTAFVLPQLAEQFPGQYELRKYDTGIKENVLRLIEVQKRLNVDDNATVSMVVNGKIYLGGYDHIKDKLFETLRQCQNGNAAAEAVRPDARPPRAASFTVAAVVLAGLLDGINPCVFSTLVFFITLLLTLKVSKIKLLLAGGIYCLACFLTYLALGFGLFRFLKLFSGYHGLQSALNGIMFLILLALAAFSFADAWRYRRTGQPGAVKLQLPDRIKTRIHCIMRSGVKYHFLLPGIFGVGIMVTGLESVCTGQVYVPTLILLTQETGLASKWFLYLLLYNLMFIVPLLLLFSATYFGASTPQLLTWSKRNVISSKLLLGLLFLALAIMIL